MGPIRRLAELTGRAWKAIEVIVAVIAVIAFVIMAAGRIGIWVFPDSELTNYFYYWADGELTNAKIVIMRLPHDCEFLTAPIGSKRCHYKRSVSTVRVRHRDSVVSISYDGGKTWITSSEAIAPEVDISWDRVDD